MFSLRPAKQGDTSRMASIRTRTLRERARDSYSETELDVIAPESPSPDRGTETIRNDSFDVIVAEEEEILGFGVVHPADGQIHGLYVDPGTTGDGVGSTILEELERRCREAGRESVFALATLNAAPFYRKRGYETVEERAISENPEIPVVHVEKSLTERKDE